MLGYKSHIKAYFCLTVSMNAASIIAINYFFYKTRKRVILGEKAKRLNEYYQMLEDVGYFGIFLQYNHQARAVDTPNSTMDTPKGTGSSGTMLNQLEIISNEALSRGFDLFRVRWIVPDDKSPSVAQTLTTALSRIPRLLAADFGVLLYLGWVIFVLVFTAVLWLSL